METSIGVVTHYYNRIQVAVMKLSEPVFINDMVHFLGNTTDFYQKVFSLEINHHKIQSAEGGAEVAIQVEDVVRRGDEVFKVED